MPNSPAHIDTFDPTGLEEGDTVLFWNGEPDPSDGYFAGVLQEAVEEESESVQTEVTDSYPIGQTNLPIPNEPIDLDVDRIAGHRP